MNNDPCICKKFTTDLYHPSTRFNNQDPCDICGHRLKDHPQFRKRHTEPIPIPNAIGEPKMIPLSVVDAKIKKYEALLPKDIKPEEYDYVDQARLLFIQYLRGLKKEAIPITTPTKEEFDTLSHQSIIFVNSVNREITELSNKIQKLEKEIKKEAIPVEGQPLEPLSCPFCNWGESDNEINIARHFEKEHEYKALLMLAKILLGNKTTEQRIRDRITFLEKQPLSAEPMIPLFTTQNAVMAGAVTQGIIDELRKLLK